MKYIKELTMLENNLLQDIKYLVKSKGRCWAGNEHFAEKYGRDKRTISRAIGRLLKLGYITYTMNFANNTRDIFFVENENVPNVQECRDVTPKMSWGIDKNDAPYKEINKQRGKQSIKKESKPPRETFDQILGDFVDGCADGDERLRFLLGEFLKTRFAQGKPPTNAALSGLLAQLRDFGGNDTASMCAIVQNSINGGYAQFYPPKDQQVPPPPDNGIISSFDASDLVSIVRKPKEIMALWGEQNDNNDM